MELQGDSNNRAMSCDTSRDTVWSPVVHLDGVLQENPFLSYSYNTRSLTDPQNIFVNAAVAGATFVSLGDTTNVQGIRTWSVEGEFVHIQLEQSICFNATNHVLAGSAIAEAMAVPEPAPGTFLMAGAAVLLLRRPLGGAMAFHHVKRARDIKSLRRETMTIRSSAGARRFRRSARNKGIAALVIHS